MTDLRTRAMAPRPGGRGAGLLRPGQRAARAVAWTGLVVALLTVLVVAWPDAPVLVRAPVAVGFASLGAGAAVLSHRFSREPAVTWALVVLISLATFAAGMTALAWAGWWVPHPLVLAGAVAVAVSCAAALRRPAGRPARERPRPRWDRELPGHAAVLAVGVGLWLVALAGTDLSGVGGAGLLGTVHPAFFAALLLPVAGFLAALARPGGGRGPVLGGYLVLLVLVLHGTTPLLLDQPQYAWTYKHLGVVELLLSQGGITDSGDIYQQWPGLFAAVAGLSDLSGLAPASLADGSPVFFNLAGALVLLAIGRTLSPDRRVGYLTVLVFLCVNWVEEDYLSPQAFAFLLSLGGLLVVVRWLPRRPGWWTGHGPDRWRRWYVRLTAGIRTPEVPPRSRAAALAVLLLLFGVLTTTHQLSPFLLLGQLAVLVGLVLVRPWWTVPLLAGLAVGYLLPRFGLVTGSFDVFESLNFLSNAAGSADGWGSTGQAVSATVVRTLALTVWALAGLAVWRARHQLGRVLLPAVLAVTPFVLVAVQSYGGEAIYRVFLFSAPWSAYLIADLVLRARWQRAGAGRPGRVRRAVAWGLAGLLLAGAAVATGQGRHGQLAVDQQTTAEVAAARYLYAHAQPGATIALATPTFPSRLAGNYDQFNQSVPVGEPDLVEGAQLRDDRLDFRYLPAVENYLLSFGGTTSYLVVSDGMRQQADYFGHLPDGSLDALEATLASSRGWSVFYRNEDVVIYQFDAPAQSS